MLALPKEGRRPPSEGRGVIGKATPRMDQPFDHWLHKQLHEMYDSIAKEPLPDDLLDLIDRDADNASKSQTPQHPAIDKKSKEH